MSEDNLAVYMLKLLASEVDAVRKYTMYHCVLVDQGYLKTAEVFSKEISEELGHMKKLQERLLFMNEIPGYGELAEVVAHSDVAAIIEEMLESEEEAIDMYREAIRMSINLGDYGNVTFFQSILAEEEGHYEWLKTQKQMIERLGVEGYLQVSAS